MRIVHFVAGLAEWNGMANTARQFMSEEIAEGAEVVVVNDLSAIVPNVDLVYIHGAWLPVLWRAARRAKQIGARLIVRPAGSYDPVRLAYHGWKKRLVGPIERFFLRRADVVVATCEAEKEWILKYEPRVKKVEVTDMKRFFDFSHSHLRQGYGGQEEHKERKGDGKLHLLYLGRRHPLKGIEYLERAVSEIGVDGGLELRVESSVFGEEKERVWDWCDVLVLPTLSENFGRVVAEALEHGKRVITTDGAPAWGEEGLESKVWSSGSGEGEIWSGYGGRLIYLKGYRDGDKDIRVKLLRQAIEGLKA